MAATKKYGSIERYDCKSVWVLDNSTFQSSLSGNQDKQFTSVRIILGSRQFIQ